MHTMGLSVPEKNKLTLLDELGKINGKEVIAALNQGKTLKITVDNIDGRIKANQVSKQTIIKMIIKKNNKNNTIAFIAVHIYFLYRNINNYWACLYDVCYM